MSFSNLMRKCSILWDRTTASAVMCWAEEEDCDYAVTFAPFALGLRDGSILFFEKLLFTGYGWVLLINETDRRVAYMKEPSPHGGWEEKLPYPSIEVRISDVLWIATCSSYSYD